MLKIGENAGGLYKIASMPFETKEETENWIKEYWKGSDAKAYRSERDGKWYIICK